MKSDIDWAVLEGGLPSKVGNTDGSHVYPQLVAPFYLPF